MKIYLYTYTYPVLDCTVPNRSRHTQLWQVSLSPLQSSSAVSWSSIIWAMFSSPHWCQDLVIVAQPHLRTILSSLLVVVLQPSAFSVCHWPLVPEVDQRRLPTGYVVQPSCWPTMKTRVEMYSRSKKRSSDFLQHFIALWCLLNTYHVVTIVEWAVWWSTNLWYTLLRIREGNSFSLPLFTTMDRSVSTEERGCSNWILTLTNGRGRRLSASYLGHCISRHPFRFHLPQGFLLPANLIFLNGQFVAPFGSCDECHSSIVPASLPF